MEKLYLFSNTRAIKDFFERNYNASFLPNAQSIGEFFDSILRVEAKSKIPPFLRYVYLYQAIKEVNPQKFGEFAKNFSQFLVNSDFFFKFYDELCAECVQIESLERLDIYAFYDDHLQVLKNIFKTYQDKIAQNGFFDKYFLENYQITFELLSQFDEIEVHLEGFLSCFEMYIFKEISMQKPIVFKISINAFNQEYYQRIFGIELENGDFILHLKKGDIKKDSFEPTKTIKYGKINLLEFSDRVSEVGGTFSQIDLWLERGIQPEEICIVLPSEEFKNYLELFDGARNFNFAMGKKLQETALFVKIEEHIEQFKDFGEFQNFIIESQEVTREDKEAKKIILQNLEHFSYSLKYLEFLPIKDKIYTFFMMLKKLSIDDIGGGRISVMGILETRGIEFSYIIVPEFNENNVPKVNQKDIFLNSLIREKVGLPTKKDRENLQKYYYSRLFEHSLEVGVMFLNNDEDKPSRFLLDDKIFSEARFYKASKKYGDYFLSGKALQYKEREIVAPLELGIMSASKLECLLTCARKYYYRYVLGYKEENSNMGANVGMKLHKVLQEAYSSYQTHHNFAQLQEEVYRGLQDYETKREFFELELAKRYLQKFFKTEQEHLQEGWIPVEFERKFSFGVCGIPFEGRIDRIDKKGQDFFVLDYKYKRNLKIGGKRSIENSKDFQLVLYAMAIQEIHSNAEVKAGFYDIYEAKIKEEKALIEKKEKLEERLEYYKGMQKEFSFELCKERSPCSFCEFIYLCKRY